MSFSVRLEASASATGGSSLAQRVLHPAADPPQAESAGPQDVKTGLMSLVWRPEMKIRTVHGGAVGRVGGGTDAAREAAKDDDSRVD